MKTTDTYGAELIDVMGSDLTVVSAARVSFEKQSDWDLEPVIGRLGANEFLEGYNHTLKEADKRLIAYLAKYNHWSPFAHPQLSFRVSAPIFVARQLQKHVVGLAWNEVSRRYVKAEPSIYVPGRGEWRLKADNVKQGSSDEFFPGTPYENNCGRAYTPKSLMNKCASLYNSMIAQGICPEQARMVLPQSMMTEWVWTGSLYAFARVCNQRLKPDAQRECRPIAEDIARMLGELFPVSWGALRGS